MTIIYQEAERVVLGALADPNTPRQIRTAINEAFNTSKIRKTRVRTEIGVAQNPNALLTARIAAFQVLVDFMTGESVA